MSEPPRIGVSFVPAAPEKALFARPREQGVALAWQSSFIPPYEDFLNLDGLIVLDLVGGAVEAVEILHMEIHGARSAPANDVGPTHKMFVNLSNRQEIERAVTISPKRHGVDLVFAIEKAPTSERGMPLGGGLEAWWLKRRSVGYAW